VGLHAGEPALDAARHTHYFTGRSDNFDPATLSTDGDDARLDPESVRVSRDGRHVYISDEYGPHVYEFDRLTGLRVRTFALPAELAVPVQSPEGAVEISGNTVGRVANKGMEGLALTPDGRTLVGAMQSPLIQDGGTSAQFIRLVAIDVRTGATRQHAYGLTNIGTPPSRSTRRSARSWRSTITSSWSTSATARAWATTPSPRSSRCSTSISPAPR
jgi:hypothetical protein